MSQKLWLRVAGLSGASSVGAAAYGAHGMKDKDETLKMVYENGNKLHMVHSAGILAGAASANAMFNPTLTLGLFTVGTVVFSGSCYASALTEDRANGKFAPIGGSALILAWLSIFV